MANLNVFSGTGFARNGATTEKCSEVFSVTLGTDGILAASRVLKISGLATLTKVTNLVSAEGTYIFAFNKTRFAYLLVTASSGVVVGLFETYDTVRVCHGGVNEMNNKSKNKKPRNKCG